MKRRAHEGECARPPRGRTRAGTHARHRGTGAGAQPPRGRRAPRRAPALRRLTLTPTARRAHGGAAHPRTGRRVRGAGRPPRIPRTAAAHHWLRSLLPPRTGSRTGRVRTPPRDRATRRRSPQSADRTHQFGNRSVAHRRPVHRLRRHRGGSQERATERPGVRGGALGRRHPIHPQEPGATRRAPGSGGCPHRPARTCRNLRCGAL